MWNSRLLILLGLASAYGVLAGCPADEEPVVDDDDSAAGDDDSALGDDDDTADSSCDVPSVPLTVEFSGAYAGSFTFDSLTCEDYNGDVWNMTYTGVDNPWRMRIQAGPLPASGPMTDGNIVVTLLNNSESPTITMSGLTQMGHVAGVDVVEYNAPDSPCLWWTTDPVGPEGNQMIVSPQPIPLHCP